jgi:hypothetical protein
MEDVVQEHTTPASVTTGRLADMVSSGGVWAKDALWWGMVWAGGYFAYQQGWLPFLQPPHLQRQLAAQQAAWREQHAASQSASAASDAPPAVPEDPATAVRLRMPGTLLSTTRVHAACAPHNLHA